MTGWSEERRMAHHRREREQFYAGLGVHPDTCTMDVVTADEVPAPSESDVEARLPPPTLVMDASGLPSDYFAWPESTRKDYIRSNIPAYDQQRLYGSTGFVFEDPGAK